MTACDNCGVDAFMPVTNIRLIQENVLETHFCSEECLVEFFQEVISK